MENPDLLYIKNYKRKIRRDLSEKWLLRRIKLVIPHSVSYRGFRNLNKTVKYKILPSDFLGTQTYFAYKNYSTGKYNSKYKIKYSPNRNKGYYYSKINTRMYEKNILLKELKENEIK
jgi:hypothetical protein